MVVQVCKETILLFGDLRTVIKVQLEYVKKCRLRHIVLKERWKDYIWYQKCIMWMIRYEIKGFTSESFDKSARLGRLDVVQWLYKNGERGTTKAMDYAAEYGYFDLLLWLHENGEKGCTQAALDSAALHGHFGIVQWLHQTCQKKCSYKAMYWASLHPFRNHDLTRYLQEHSNSEIQN